MTRPACLTDLAVAEFHRYEAEIWLRKAEAEQN
jgi:hypothetical protein